MPKEDDRVKEGDEVLGRIPGIDDWLKDLPEGPPKQEHPSQEGGGAGSIRQPPEGTAAQSSRFYIVQVSDFLLGSRNPYGTLFESDEDSSLIIKSTTPDNKVINIYRKVGTDIFGVRLGYKVEHPKGGMAIAFNSEGGFEFSESEIEVVWFRVIKEGGNEIRILNIDTAKSFYEIRDDGIINVSDRT